MNSVPAILLAGGFGTRLLEVTHDLIPKSLVNVAGKPILEHVLDNLLNVGVGDVCIAVGHKAEEIKLRYKNRYKDLNITYSKEDSPLGTGGAAFLASKRNSWGQALVLNSDTYVEVPLEDLRITLTKNATIAVALATRVSDVSHFGELQVKNDFVVGFGEKTGVGPGLIYAGVALIDFALAAEQLDLPFGKFSLETDVLARLSSDRKLRFIESGSKFIDVGTPARLIEGQKLLDNGQ